MADVIIPKMGMSTNEVEIKQWLVKVGDRVQVGTLLVEIESEKATVEVESTVAGIVGELLAAENDFVEVGSLICRIAEE